MPVVIPSWPDLDTSRNSWSFNEDRKLSIAMDSPFTSNMVKPSTSLTMLQDILFSPSINFILLVFFWNYFQSPILLNKKFLKAVILAVFLSD